MLDNIELYDYDFHNEMLNYRWNFWKDEAIENLSKKCYGEKE